MREIIRYLGENINHLWGWILGVGIAFVSFLISQKVIFAVIYYVIKSIKTLFKYLSYFFIQRTELFFLKGALDKDKAAKEKEFLLWVELALKKLGELERDRVESLPLYLFFKEFCLISMEEREELEKKLLFIYHKEKRES